MTRIGFATYAGVPEITDDDALAADVLHHRGVHVSPVLWESGGGADGAWEAVVVRSCWDYHLAPERFAAWAGAVEASGTPLLNPAGVVRWNLHKGYLRELQEAGVAVPPTAWIERGGGVSLADVLRERGWERAVVKPAVSLSAYETWRTSAAQAGGEPHAGAFAALVAERDVLVQAYVGEVEQGGELSFVFLGGAYSHAVRKRPRPGDFRVQADHGGSREPCAPSAALVAQAEAVVDAVSEPLTYARVDAVEVGGRLVVMELELIDPVLFLAYDPGAPARFADAITRAVS